MATAVFPYPGGKSRFAKWILEHVPEHTCFVEVFGGAAGVLMNKDPDTSDVEVYNDRDEDLVQFFEVLRDRPDELVEFLESAPYSRSVHDEWADAFYNGYRPADPVVRAGRFFYLRYTQFGGVYDSKAGLGTSKVANEAQAYSNKRARLEELAERFDDVLLERLDWQAVIEKYDGPETVFYCDPPYVGEESTYPVSAIDHQALRAVLADCEGTWFVSYSELPEGYETFTVLERGAKRFINSGTSGSANDVTERLVTNVEQ